MFTRDQVTQLNATLTLQYQSLDRIEEARAAIGTRGPRNVHAGRYEDNVREAAICAAESVRLLITDIIEHAEKNGHASTPGARTFIVVPPEPAAAAPAAPKLKPTRVAPPRLDVLA